MVRIVACIVAATFLTAGLGCGLQQQSSPVTATVSPPAQEVDSVWADNPDEADPERMTLSMKNWTWIRTVYNNDTTVVPTKPNVFTLSFSEDGKLNATTDCNRMTGSYSIDGRLLSFSKLASTRMFCPDSQEGEFADMLGHVTAFLFTSRGELILELKYDSGQLVFR